MCRARVLSRLGCVAFALITSGCSGVDPFGDRPYVAAARSSAPTEPFASPPPATAPVAPPPMEPPAAAPSETPAPTPATVADEDRRMFEIVNRIRAERGLRAFRWNDRLHRAAIDHSAEQHRFGYMGHGSPDPARDDLADRVRLAGYSARAWAEVVAWGYRGPEDVVQGWMDSRGHRHILLDADLQEAGFSRVGDYFTGDFGTPLPASASRR